ncbi:GlxA family transcriptional regulator [Microbacterium sp. ASV49]|uniref:DJ-1/PfpI family protein n=1 Tax=Microbacterium candidum TaxID=3041922 RepID=A0ABT7MW69_9MICO|nr:helix-turn-helix domain-containing protein [Microbacterium sp. ASV49]MDL9978698.1 DJ-1/PfpI family protein [Microbacterium sp. ASV49]
MHKDSATPRRIAVVAPERVVAFDFTIPFEVFSRPELCGAFDVVGCAERPGVVTTTTSIGLCVDADLSAVVEAHAVIVPGFDLAARQPESLLRALTAAHERGALIASICTGAFILAAAGLLDGRTATTHWQRTAQLATEYPNVIVDPNVLYTEQDGVFTSAGVTAGVDLCLHMLERDLGAQSALEVARSLVMPRHRMGGQAQYRPAPLISASGPVAAALRRVAVTVGEVRSVSELARKANVSVRSLHRHCLELTGYSPGEWLAREKISLACRLLEDPTLSVDEVAMRAGLGTASNLRLRFASVLGVTPTAYRRAFAPLPAGTG